jgi:hypothetical protein
LGEIFECSWEHEDSTSFYVGEQVSHHPPITAFHMINEKAGFALSGHALPKQSFSGNSVDTLIEGKMRIDLLDTKEQMFWKPQGVSATGVFMGEQSIQFYDQGVLISKDFKATVDFYVNVFIFLYFFNLKKKNSLDGGIYDLNNKSRIYSINGNIDDKVYITSTSTGLKKVLFDAKDLVLPKLIVEDVAKQSKNSSRRNWHPLTVALVKKDWELANKEKHKIEERERAIRKERKEEWKPALFVMDEVDKRWVYKKSTLPKDEILNVNEEDSNSWGGYIKSFFF